jgi:HSP20 family molecular chaperone IbpA
LFPDLLDWLETGLPGFPVLRGSRTDLHSIAIEMTEDENSCTLRAELPGMDPAQDIEVTATGDVLAIRAQHGETKQDRHRSEFRYGSFQRVVRLPFTIPEEGVEAQYRSGILTLHIPKPAQAKESARKIEVKPTE